jgi:hypothetical protein
VTSSHVLDKYRPHLEAWTYAGQDWSAYEQRPRSRYETFRRAFELFRTAGGRRIVELGTIRSYTHGALPACNTDDRSAWTPDDPANWDWGAGYFSRLAAECLADLTPDIVTVDAAMSHLARCRVVTEPFSDLFTYVCQDSRDFLRDASGPVDLLYLDTGDITPIEPTAQLQLEEARLVVERDLVPPGGVVLIDDVQNQTPRAHGERSTLGKAKYSLPFLLAHGFTADMREYQYLLVRDR